MVKKVWGMMAWRRVHSSSLRAVIYTNRNGPDKLMLEVKERTPNHTDSH